MARKKGLIHSWISNNLLQRSGHQQIRCVLKLKQTSIKTIYSVSFSINIFRIKKLNSWKKKVIPMTNFQQSPKKITKWLSGYKRILAILFLMTICFLPGSKKAKILTFQMSVMHSLLSVDWFRQHTKRYSIKFSIRYKQDFPSSAKVQHRRQKQSAVYYIS